MYGDEGKPPEQDYAVDQEDIELEEKVRGIAIL